MHLKGRGIGYDRERKCLKPERSEEQNNETDNGEYANFIFYLLRT